MRRAWIPSSRTSSLMQKMALIHMELQRCLVLALRLMLNTPRSTSR